MDWIVLLIAGFIGGFLNALAGGGSFVTMPAFIWFGLPAVTANASATAALLPGYIASAWRFRSDIKLPKDISFSSLVCLSLLGGSIGALILLNTNNQVFSFLIPWLILLATSFFIAGPWLLKNIGKGKAIGKLSGLVLLFVVCIYGGYFNGGLGIILLAALALMGATNLKGMNGIKNIVSALLTVIAVCIYGLGSKLAYLEIAITAVAAIAGGYAGASFSYLINEKWLKAIIIMIGFIMALLFFMR